MIGSRRSGEEDAIARKVFDELPLREHGISRILTHDTDLHRFPFLEVEDPLTEI